MPELTPEIIALLGAASVIAGFIDAIAGGGGLISLPALLSVGLNPVAAIATNKVQGSVGTASALWNFWRKGRVDFRLIRWPLALTAVGAGLGAFAVTLVDTRWLMIVLPVQFTWAAASGFCGHESGIAAKHFGHHEHKHSGQAQTKETKAASLSHADCEMCHFGFSVPSVDVLITADTYYAEAKIKERGLQHWIDGLGNWDGYNSANYSNVDVRNGYVVGGTIRNRPATGTCNEAMAEM